MPRTVIDVLGTCQCSHVLCEAPVWAGPAGRVCINFSVQALQRRPGQMLQHQGHSKCKPGNTLFLLFGFPFAFWCLCCLVCLFIVVFFFFYPMLPRCLSKSLLHILLLPFSPLHCVMQGCNTLVAKMRKDGSEVLGTAFQRLVILVVSRTHFSVYLTYIYCFEFMRQSCCLWISVELQKKVGIFQFLCLERLLCSKGKRMLAQSLASISRSAIVFWKNKCYASDFVQITAVFSH